MTPLIKFDCGIISCFGLDWGGMYVEATGLDQDGQDTAAAVRPDRRGPDWPIISAMAVVGILQQRTAGPAADYMKMFDANLQDGLKQLVRPAGTIEINGRLFEASNTSCMPRSIPRARQRRGRASLR